MAKKKAAKKKPARAKARTSARKDLPARAKAGKVRGGVARTPSVSDEVIVAFAHGDIRAPVVTGNLWNSNDRPPISG
ncbi:MAG TPA: phage baseplate assembly protein V [Methylomirabilota bacterium]|jgi:Type VI secretion system/phage-baseplate injector OB domain|nr:phage baseplate assembly protein V [Methylomirabilota bacterium]